MTKEQAYEKLELPVGTDLQVVRQKFNQMHNEFLMQIDGVSFNPAMKQRKEQQLEELKEAYALLNESEGMDDSASLPRTERTFDHGGGETRNSSSDPEPSKPKEQQGPPPPPPPREETQQPEEQAPPVYSAPPHQNKSKGLTPVYLAVGLCIIGVGIYFATRTPAAPPIDVVAVKDSAVWNTAYGSGDEDAYTRYITQYPDGIFTQTAEDSIIRIRLERFQQAEELYANENYTEAAKLFHISADQGDSDAQSYLGSMYSHGTGVTKDYAEAAKWYQKAADQGDVLSQYNLGWMYENGHGVSQSHTEAIKWYQKAADQENAHGQYAVGVMHYNGNGVTKNMSEAIKWFKKAAKQGNQEAIDALKILE